MNWLLAVALALGAFAAIFALLKAPRSAWEATAATLLLGIAGYGVQASPGLPGAPKAPAQQAADNPAAIVEARERIGGQQPGDQKDRWIMVADGFARNGEFANAAGVLLGAVEENPKNADAWLALGNALLAHSDGLLTPASFHAYSKAAELAPEHPGPPFFLGLALAQSGRFNEAKATWNELLERSSADAPWRADLQSRIERLDALIASQEGAAAAQ